MFPLMEYKLQLNYFHSRCSNMLRMRNSTFSLKVLVPFLLLSFKISNGLQIVVNSVNGSDTSCQKNLKNPCKSIEQASKLINSSSSIVIKSDVILHQILTFYSLHNVSIIGDNNGNAIRITCEGQAGIFVNNVQGFSMSQVKILRCTHHQERICEKGAVIIHNTTEVSIRNVSIIRSNYSGLTLMNCRGNINITDVNFLSNRYIKWNYKPVNKSQEFLRSWRCRQGAIGGGLNIIFQGNTQNSSTTVDRCYFNNNSAHWGGGLHIILSDKVANHAINVSSTIFEGNNAWKEGGGLRFNIKCPTQEALTNTAHFYNTSFIANTAKFGSGTGIIAVYNENKYKNQTILFSNCTWRDNTATVTSPAVDIASYAVLNSQRYGFLPTPKFRDIKIINNTVESLSTLVRNMIRNDGVFLVTQMKVFLSGYVCFSSNSPTALKAVSGGIAIDDNTTVMFFNNTGTNGAAIALYGFSYIFLSTNIYITFKNNMAKKTGAAIYYHGIDQHDFFADSYCFLENKNKKPDNVTIMLDGNESENGSWIFSESFLSCAIRCKARVRSNALQLNDFMKCIANFTYTNNTNTTVQTVASTSGRRFKFLDPTKRNTYSVIPGRELRIPYIVVDEFNSTLYPLTYVSKLDQHSPIVFDRKYTLDNTIYPLGVPNTSTIVDVAVDGVRSIHFQFRLSTLHCPPGFVYSDETKSCECGNDKKAKYYYSPIKQCTKNTSQAILDKEYWVGYIPENSQNFTDLYFAPCFPPICRSNTVYLDNSTKTLNYRICGKYRHSIMCGKCYKNYSVFYNSKSYACGSNRYCQYGPIFYVLSELFPVLIVFMIVLAFDLSLTSGNVVGLIFFSQYLEGTIISTDTRLDYYKLPYRFFYGILNLDYFSIERFSFCLWKGFDVQDLFVFKYVTVAFAFSLVVLQILSLKRDRFLFIFKVRKYFGQKKSFIHGLCAFLVICYIQCTKTSLLILKPIQPVGHNGRLGHHYTYYGGERYFVGKHKLYSSFAVLSLATTTVFPTMILFLYPFLLQLLSLCNLSEHWLVLKALKLLHIQNLIPFLDCFQSCYKDRCRMFAGLYFMYKVSLLLWYVMAKSYTSLLLGLQLHLLVILAIHATFQPYKKRIHNVIDSLVFSNLLLINVLTIIDNIMETSDKKSARYSLEVVQIFLNYLPMIACLLSLLWKIIGYFKFKKNYYNYDIVDEDRNSNGDYQECQLSASIVTNNN